MIFLKEKIPLLPCYKVDKVSSRVGYNETFPLNSETIYRNPETVTLSE